MGLTGKAEFVQDGIHEVARAVSGKGPSGAVRPVCSGSESKNEDACARVSEAGNGATPVGLVLVGAAFGFGYATTVGAETGAALAVDDGLLNLQEGVGRTLWGGSFHCIP